VYEAIAMETVWLGIAKSIEVGFEGGEEVDGRLAGAAILGVTAWSCAVLGALIANEADGE